MTNADELMQKGYDICFSGSSEKDLAEGRGYFLRAASSGRSDAHFFLGRSYEKHFEYAEAAQHYEAGLNEGHMAAIYRLALLHDGSKLDFPDRDFYLKTLNKLASEDYAAAIANRLRERLRGSYGLAGFAVGILMLIPDFVRIYRIAEADPDGPLLQK